MKESETYGYKEHPKRILKHWLAGPFIWFPLLPMLLLDVCIEIYHRIAFPLYSLPYKKRSEYIIFDRQKLSYLPWYDKFFCTYCAYGNGFLLYASAIAAETEKYWCGIKHQRARIRVLKDEEKDYLDFGDKKAFDKVEKEGKKSQD
jgi:hypothetical protein